METNAKQQQQQGVKIFGSASRIGEDMKLLKAMSKEESLEYMSFGNKMLDFAKQGQVEDLKAHVEGYGRPPLQWHVVKGFLAACRNGHADVVQFFINGGVEKKNPRLQSAFHETVFGSVDTGTIAALARAGFDVNFMRKPDYFTPLHCALKLKKSCAALALIEHGADVNAVAEGDVMPLPLALAARAESSDEGIEKCIEVCRRCGCP